MCRRDGSGIYARYSLSGRRQLIIYTIGHSTRPLDQFMAILAEAAVSRVADVRAFPASRRHPQFNKDALSASLSAIAIDYVHLPALGGRRGAKPKGPSRNTLWRVDAFRHYADYAETTPFRAAIAQLGVLAAERATAFMCAEALWWQCHRRLIADYMLVAGWEVIHLLALSQRQQHVL